MERIISTESWLNKTFMLMTPDDKMKEGIQESFWEVIGHAMFCVVLVDHHDVEPFVVEFLWSHHLDLKKVIYCRVNNKPNNKIILNS